jgi:plasmid stability protein
MSAMIQVRNVPDEVHRTLKARAALAGKSLSELVLEELTAMTAVPSEAELKKQLEKAKPFKMTQSSATIVRHERDVA